MTLAAATFSHAKTMVSTKVSSASFTISKQSADKISRAAKKEGSVASAVCTVLVLEKSSTRSRIQARSSAKAACALVQKSSPEARIWFQTRTTKIRSLVGTLYVSLTPARIISQDASAPKTETSTISPPVSASPITPTPPSRGPAPASPDTSTQGSADPSGTGTSSPATSIPPTTQPPQTESPSISPSISPPVSPPSASASVTAPAVKPVYTATFLTAPTNALSTQDAVFRAKVLDQNGNPAAGVSITFKFRPNTSTFDYTTMGTAQTDSSGEVQLAYRFGVGTPQVFAGSESTSNYDDFWTSGVTVTVAKPVYTATFLTAPTNALSTQDAVFRAKVLDQNGNPAAGVSITFKFRPNTSTFDYTTMGTAQTDSSGEVQLAYRFGVGTPQVFAGSESTSNYDDFWTSGVTVTVAKPVYTATVISAPTSGSTSQDLTFRVKVLDQNGNVAEGVLVTFRFRANSSTSFFTEMGTAQTGSNGEAEISYRFSSAGNPQVTGGSEATSAYDRFFAPLKTVSITSG